MRRKLVLLAVVIGISLHGSAPASEPNKRSTDPKRPSSARLLDFERWLGERLQEPGRSHPLRDPSREPRDPRRTQSASPETTCDPSRSHCPIG